LAPKHAIYFGTFYFDEFKPHKMSIKDGIVLIFVLFGFKVLFSLQNLQNKWHANIKGVTVLEVTLQHLQILAVTPKSGDVALQMAPMLAAANMASTVSIQFGK